jgi:hypothetical protein
VRHQSHVVFDHLIRLVALQLEHPLQPNGLVPSWEIVQLPSLVALNRVDFIMHCHSPSFLSLRLSKGAWLPRASEHLLCLLELYLLKAWVRLTEQVFHCAIAQWGIIVVIVEA